MKPSRPISAMSSRGIFLSSSIAAACGNTFSRAKSRAVRWTSCCSSLSVRSNPDVSVVVVVTMVVLQRVDADVPAVRILREEEVAMELTDGAARARRLVVRGAHIGDPEPHHESRRRPDLLRRLAVVALVHHDLRVRGLEPCGIRAGIAREADDLAVEALGLRALRAEQHHRADLRVVDLAHV